jgi:ubiquinone/menaquinone biosynthesis C-methylase UbiE
MSNSSSLRHFSTDKHLRGQWDTRVAIAKNPFIRAIISYCSLKRALVDTLAKTSKAAHFVLDGGCGKGAYSHWYLGKRPLAVCIAVDWSEAALRTLRPAAGGGQILRLCADVRFLPLTSGSMDALFSIDTLGHIDNCASALDEFSRVCKNGAPLFLHSECGDYRKKWPDSALIRRLGEDLIARHDGHNFLKEAAELYRLYSRRFQIQSFIHPAGYCGFILGYPEKYRMAFMQAHYRFLFFLTSIFALLKTTPALGAAIRLLNALTNHCEVFLGLKGGGSCFALMKKP